MIRSTLLALAASLIAVGGFGRTMAKMALPTDKLPAELA